MKKTVILWVFVLLISSCNKDEVKKEPIAPVNNTEKTEETNKTSSVKYKKISKIEDFKSTATELGDEIKDAQFYIERLYSTCLLYTSDAADE